MDNQRKFFDISDFSKEKLLDLMSCASRAKVSAEFKEDLTGFNDSTDDVIEMIRAARYNGFYVFKEIINNTTEYEVGCRFWTEYKDLFEVNIRTNETDGNALIAKFDLKERKPRLRSWWRLGT